MSLTKLAFFKPSIRLLKSYLGIISLFFSSIVHSDWILVGVSESDNDSYIDRVEKVNNRYIKYWTLSNHKEMNKEGLHSTQAKAIGDCEDLSLAFTYMVFYSKTMGHGDVLDSSTNSFPTYKPAVPGSIGESMLVAACAQAGIFSKGVKNVLASSVTKNSQTTAEPLTVSPLASSSVSITDLPKPQLVISPEITPLETPQPQVVLPPAITPLENPQGKFKVSVKSIQANVRELPDTSSKVLGTVQSGMILTASNILGNFYEVTTSAGKGFIHKSTVDLILLNDQKSAIDAKNI